MKENKTKVQVMTFEKFHGKQNVGSSQIRGRWLVDKWNDAEIFKYGVKSDVIIYQKVCWVEHAKKFDGLKILDLCDPDHLHWAYRTKEMIEECDVITVATILLYESLKKITDKPVYLVPDRLNLDKFKDEKEHTGNAKTVVWFGYSQNFPMLETALKALAKRGLNLVVVSNDGFEPQINYQDKIEIANYAYEYQTAYQIIQEKGDLVINPQAKTGKWKYKSNNKTLISWALGLPVATSIEDLDSFISEEDRKEEVKKRKQELSEYWDIKYSVREYEKIIEDNKKN